MRGTAAIVGVGESQYYRPGGSPDTEFQLAITAIKNAAAGAGIDYRDIDGFVSFASERNVPTRLATALGVKETRYASKVWDGGGNGVAGAVALADAAVTAGYANYVVCYRSLAQGQFGRIGGSRTPDRYATDYNAYRVPYGLMVPAHWYAMIAMRFMHEHGITENALAEISLASYEHAQRNPRAIRYGKGITKEDYLNSRWIVEPFRLFDCCQQNDCAAAAIVTTADRARDLRSNPAYIRAAVQGGIDFRGAAGGAVGAGYSDPGFPTAHFKTIAENLWSRAGIGPKDVQVAQFYENFTGMAMIALCEMGITTPDKVEEWLVAGNARWPHGSLPINTSGANLAEAYVHGFEIMVEGARQVWGESTSQVKDVEYSLVVSGPGALPGSAAILSAHP